MLRSLLSLAFVLIAAGAASGQTAIPPAKPLIYYAGQAGRLTEDRDYQGGNPFASALIAVLKAPKLSLPEFGERLAFENMKRSGGWHVAQLPKRKELPAWSVLPGGQEKRIALVLINSDYTTEGVANLPGARFDAKRVPRALEAAGFETQLVYNADDQEVRKAVEAFSARSAGADAALVYIGGHGVQHGRQVYWMFRDYPARDSRFLPTHALSLDQIGAALQAKVANLILYASCRDDPFND